MKPPQDDIDDRRPVWGQLQVFWMDTERGEAFNAVVAACAASKYSRDELAQIFWNEVEPAVGWNMWDPVAPEWAGFDDASLTRLVLERHRFGKPLPNRAIRPNATAWWRRLDAAIAKARA